MNSLLLTGGTGTLGREVRRILVDRQHLVRVLSRSKQTGADGSMRCVGDLRKNVGLERAVHSVDTIVHCATGSDDFTAAQNLIAAAIRADVSHFIYISIVGVDRIPFGYYRTKLRVEQLLKASGLPFTILRATQFHNLVHSIFAAQRYSPVLFIPDIEVQPIEVTEVAERLVQCALTSPGGRVADIGGPQVRPIRDLAGSYLAFHGGRRRVVGLPIRGKAITAFRAGSHLCPNNRYGTGTFEEFLARRAGAGSSAG